MCWTHVFTCALVRGCLGSVGTRRTRGACGAWVCWHTGTQGFAAWAHSVQGCKGAWAQPARGAHLSLSPLSRRQHSNAEFASVAALLAHYSGTRGGCFCRLAPGRRNPGYEERDPGGGASTSAGAGEGAWAPAAPIGVQIGRAHV